MTRVYTRNLGKYWGRGSLREGLRFAHKNLWPEETVNLEKTSSFLFEKQLFYYLGNSPETGSYNSFNFLNVYNNTVV